MEGRRAGPAPGPRRAAEIEHPIPPPSTSSGLISRRAVSSASLGRLPETGVDQPVTDEGRAETTLYCTSRRYVDPEVIPKLVWPHAWTR